MNAATIKLRTLARKAGLIRVVQRMLPKRDYEEKFSNELLSALMPGDTVWDIGANVGYYTSKFAQITGKNGLVLAFEPAPGCVEKLNNLITELPGGSAPIEVVQAAVSDKEGKLFFSLAADPTGVTHQLINSSSNSDRDCIEVSVVTGDSMAEKRNIPNVIKIDVEGFEEEVLFGMKELLRQPQLRAIFCEVHFNELAKRGKAQAPIRIESMLKEAGFSVSWPSHSHIAARRK